MRCFVNLVNFNALWGHRRDPVEYGHELERFDEKLDVMLHEIKDDDFVNAITPNGQLFSTRQLSKSEKEINTEFSIDYAQIEDLDVIKALMDYVYKKRDPDSTIYRKKKAAFEQIKKIAFDSGIINNIS